MDRCIVFLLMIGAMLFTVTSASNCTNGTYPIEGKCTGICGYCLGAVGNNTVVQCEPNGLCKKISMTNEKKETVVEALCKSGWKGAACKDAICDEDCGSGKCIGPNTCFCGYDINIVGPNCEDIRVRGVVGSIAAFATVTASIALCGLGSKLYKRRKEGASL